MSNTKNITQTAGRKLRRVATDKLCFAFLVNQFLDKKEGTKLKDVAEAVGCTQMDMWGCYHDKRATPPWIIVNLCVALGVENASDLAVQVLKIERERKAERIAKQEIDALARERERKKLARPQIKRKKLQDSG